ncbi:MAG TPA: hypothetical protein VFB32_16460 [Rudaea sp.]|nr:hypothetical protein [Rudaea sp.]
MGLSLLIAVAMCGAAHAQEHTVTKVGIVAKPKAYTGACPADIKFIATIFVSRHPVTVTYQWERSDGAKSAPQKVEITSSGRGVDTTWKLGAPGKTTTVWQKLHVLAPTGISSDPAEVTLDCR